VAVVVMKAADHMEMTMSQISIQFAAWLSKMATLPSNIQGKVFIFVLSIAINYLTMTQKNTYRIKLLSGG